VDDNNFTRRVHARQEPLTDISADEMHRFALEYWRRGFSVVPQNGSAKSPAVRWKPYQNDLPSRGWIDEWWLRDFQGAGIAVVLGPVSNLFAIDVDGVEAHRALIERLGGLPIAPQVQSGSGDPDRFHLYFRYPTGVETKAKATPWHDELEFRGHRGITVLPPSLHKSGNRYQWVPGRSLDDLELPELPDEVLAALKEKQPRLARRPENSRRIRLMVFDGICSETEKFLDGQYSQGPDWNGRLYRAACDLAGCGVPREKAEPALLFAASPWSPDDAGMALATITSAYSEERQSARQFAASNDSSTAGGRARVEFKVGNILVRINR